MFTIENEMLRVVINPKGAELDSIFHKGHQLEYLWAGDPIFWSKKSPVLFPIVGTLKNNEYFFEGKAYQLTRHGFARDSLFSVAEQSAAAIAFLLTANPHTYPKFPFDFGFTIKYSLQPNVLGVTYTVENHNEQKMFFSVGGHPAFRIPLVKGTVYEDYYLEFDAVENAGRWPISASGLIEAEPMPLLKNTHRLPLTRVLFYNDALVFKNLSSTRIALKSDNTPHGLELDFTGFPYLGIWAAKNANFVCIEPWCGIADSTNTNQQLTEKEGIQVLEKGQVFEKTWNLKLF